MIEQFTNWDVAVASLVSRKPSVVLIEGAASVGKSPFARSLALPIRGLVLSTDCFVRASGPETPYRDMVDRSALNLLAREARRPIIIEGICLREILDPHCFDDALTIYLKRVAADGSWPLGDEAAEFVRSEWPLCIEVEVLDYHHRICPERLANAVLTLNNDDRP